MGIKANFNMSDIEKQVNGFAADIVDKAIETLGKLGTECVNHARSIPDPENGGNGFKDQTGNLRSSIGFKIFVDGQPVIVDYKLYKNGRQGMEKGKALADQVGSQCENGQIMLVVTAGMEYAFFVEANDRDVIASSELLAKQEWPRMKIQLEEMVRRQGRSQ